jgi:hypothetical protein
LWRGQRVTSAAAWWSRVSMSARCAVEQARRLTTPSKVERAGAEVICTQASGLVHLHVLVQRAFDRLLQAHHPALLPVPEHTPRLPATRAPFPKRAPGNATTPRRPVCAGPHRRRRRKTAVTFSSANLAAGASRPCSSTTSCRSARSAATAGRKSAASF